MRIKYLFYILFFALTVFSERAAAQQTAPVDISNAKISQYTDDQITLYWQQALDKGMSEKEIYSALLKNGMSPGEVEMLKNRVTLLGLNSKNKKTDLLSTQKKKIDFTRDKNDTVIMPNLGKRTKSAQPQKLEVYGMFLFNQLDLKFEPNFSVPTPKGYVLGPGDELIVLTTGLNETEVQQNISPDGNLLIGHAGIV